MGSVTPKEDRVFPLLMIAAMSIVLATIAVSYYATDNLLIFIIDYPISVAYQPVYLGVFAFLISPLYLFMRRPSPQRVVLAGMILGLAAGVFAHDVLNVFLPLLWVGQEPASVLAMLATACVVPSGVALLQLRRQAAPKASA
jgi:hypothetical protein